MSTRPFYLICPVWGESYRRLLIDCCLPSLLAPGNIPALVNRDDSRIIFASKPEDWAAIQTEPIFGKLAALIEPIFIDITKFGIDGSGNEKYNLASRGYVAGANLAFAAKAYGTFLAPDMMLADGTFARLQQLGAAGKKLVLSSALRFNENELVGALRTAGLLVPGEPISLSPRALVRLAMPHMHSETRRYDFDSPYFTDFAFAAWWRVPGDEGMLLHTHSWAILLADYNAVRRHETGDMENMTIDAAYAYDNFGAYDEAVHVVTDTDEIGYVSFTPRDHMNPPIALNPYREYLLASMHWGNRLNPLHRDIFSTPVFMHTEDIGPNWHKKADEVAKQLEEILAVAHAESVAAREWRAWKNHVRIRIEALRDEFRPRSLYVPAGAKKTIGSARLAAGLVYYVTGGHLVGRTLLKIARYPMSLVSRLVRAALVRVLPPATPVVDSRPPVIVIKGEPAPDGKPFNYRGRVEEDPVYHERIYRQQLPHRFDTGDGTFETFAELFAEYQYDPVRLVMMMNMIERANALPEGDFAELGTHEGLMARIIYRLMDKRASLYLFDTFEGFDQRDTKVEVDKFRNDAAFLKFAPAGPEDVARVAGGGEIRPNIHCVKGWFPESFAGYESKKWRFVHIDFDLYAPIKSALETLWPNVVPGGVVIVHDYGCYAFPGAKKAVDEFFDTVGVKPIPYCDRWGSAIAIKPTR